ncbi:voltage-gated potassium channel [Oikeobacillus pervagus]|uniref:Voltage-gated potassium channel n=1 Tax=Oikeobacillus pervagus TaxID=1325931 RepID=A0AAJ1T5Z4_9BACI|nr:potassium channel family protein [Oikeobacillus pervagus]MDQ0216489.1 voltage-gated potassium channel [Oikeobacillus pervagus]
MQRLYLRFIRWPLFGRVFVMAVFLIVSFGISIHLIEPNTFPTYFEGIWWAVVTTSTVGFGDFAPKSFEGRLMAIVLIFLGVSFLSTYFASLAAAAVSSQNAVLKGEAPFFGKKHIIIIGWNERTKELIQQLSRLNDTRQITLIDETLEENLCQMEQVHFVKGTPFKDATLHRANLKEAEMVLITSDPSKNELYADMASILTLVAIKGIRPSLYTIVEILTMEQMENARRAGADEIIQTNKQASFVMLNSLIANGMSNTVLSLLDQIKGSHLKMIDVKDEWIGMSFQQLNVILLEQQILLLGIKKGEDMKMNPPPHVKVHGVDSLLVLAN